jgi:hypothetical protein
MILKYFFRRKNPHRVAAQKALPYEFQHSNPGAILEDIQKYSSKPSFLGEFYAHHEGRVMQKWHGYFHVYKRYLENFRSTDVRFLELGVQYGGSLDMWRSYFGQEARIFGIDISPACSRFDGEHGSVRIGDQSDTDFLDGVINEMGGVDVILDDGSHKMDHISASFEHLFPKLNAGGIYIVEDTMASFWQGFTGRRRGNRNISSFLEKISREMHEIFNTHAAREEGLGDYISAVHLYPGIIVFEKGPRPFPYHSYRGTIR